MQHIDVLTELPNTLSSIVLQEWLNLKCVVAVDSAYCSKLLRKRFLNTLQSEEYFIRENLVLPISCGLSFLLKFGEKLRSVIFTKKFTSVQCQYIAENCRYLKNIQFYRQNCMPELKNILQANPHIESLSVIGIDAAISSFSDIRLPKLNHCVYQGVVLRMSKFQKQHSTTGSKRV